MLSVDVLVVGMGPGGASAARVAVQAGCRVLAVEKKQRLGEPVQCAELIPLPMAAYTRAPGVLVQRISGMRTELPSGEVAYSQLPGLMIDRAAFDRAIAAEARRAGAEIHTGTMLHALDAGRRTAWLKDRDGRRFGITYEALIAADGPHSTVARLLGLSPLDLVYTRQYCVPLGAPYADTDIWLSDAFPGGYGWLFPKGGVANLGVGADRAFEPDLKRPLDQLHARLATQGRVGTQVLSRTGGATPVSGMRRLAEGRTVFVGDAAGLTHPISGAGIAAAVISGESAGCAAAQFLAGDSGALRGFEEEMREQFGPSLARALERRRSLSTCWHTAAAGRDEVMRRGWIGFGEYYMQTED